MPIWGYKPNRAKLFDLDALPAGWADTPFEEHTGEEYSAMAFREEHGPVIIDHIPFADETNGSDSVTQFKPRGRPRKVV
jgi:hypothetical protein